MVRFCQCCDNTTVRQQSDVLTLFQAKGAHQTIPCDRFDVAAEQRADALQQVQMLTALLASLFCCLFVLAMHWVSVLASLFCCLCVLALHWVSVLASLFCCLFVLALHWVLQLAGQQASRC